MAVRQRRYSKEDLAQRGQKLYETQVRQKVESGNIGRIVAIDVGTGNYEVANNVLPATNSLFARDPDAQPWIIRIGHRAIIISVLEACLNSHDLGNSECTLRSNHRVSSATSLPSCCLFKNPDLSSLPHPQTPDYRRTYTPGGASFLTLATLTTFAKPNTVNRLPLAPEACAYRNRGKETTVEFDREGLYRFCESELLIGAGEQGAWGARHVA